jgi:TolB-like protein/Tfp pilus assembly protein PilF
LLDLLAAAAMIYRFGDFELDSARFELRRAGQAVAIEPQVLSLLLLLAANPDRLVGKDELVEKIWNNRIVSDATIAARVKSARQALGDDGKQQKFVRTVHGMGFRFVGDVHFVRHAPMAIVDPAVSGPAAPSEDSLQGKPSIAVLPLTIAGMAGANAFLADALADELIADLARLRWLFVIARGSSFRFRGRQINFRQVGEALGVRYCLTGSMSFAGDGVCVAVELIEAATGGIVWADVLSDSLERVHELRREIASRTVSALELRIPLHEAHRLRAQGIGKLDAWSAFHIGLDHMFRFNRSDNMLASQMFERALEADRNFARAHAGLSFTRFQNAFLNYLPNRDCEVLAAREHAERALQLDRLDPFCHLNMGRSLWLEGDLQGSIDWLDQASALSPNYAQGIYSRAWAKTLSGEAEAGEADAKLALRLSPLDPLRYAMIATCSLSQIIKGDYAQAAVLGERAARSPGAHVYIAVIAALGTRLAGQEKNAARWISLARQSRHDLTSAHFLASFPFTRSATRDLIERELGALGL